MTDTTMKRSLSWRSFALTDVGCVREINEDAYVESPDKQFWAVLDGMGGHQKGDVASKKVAEFLEYIQPKSQLADCVDEIEDALMGANQGLVDFAREAFGSDTMGSTAVCLLIKQHVGVALWAGDSRLYRFRNNKLQQLTRDHSQVEEMLQMGLISKAEAHVHPHKNVITRAVGVESSLFVDINVFGVQAGDTFLLCSDGLYNSVSREDVENTLSQNAPEDCVLNLMKMSLANGADDNVSLIVIKEGGDSSN